MNYKLEDLEIDKVRAWLLDYYESAYFFGIGPAASDYSYVQNASDEELIEFINKAGFNFDQFKKGRKR